MKYMPQKNYTAINVPIEPISQPTTAISSPVKEDAPISNKPVEVGPIHEVVEHKIEDKEVGKHVQVHPERIEVPPDLQKMGVQATTQQPTFPAVQGIKIPLSDDKVLTGMHAPIYSSMRWLSQFCMYLLWQGHTSIKNVHGKIVRVVKR